MALCGFAIFWPILFSDLRTQNFHKSANTVHTISPHTNSIQYSNLNLYITQEPWKRRLLGLFWDKVMQYFVEICIFAICGLAYLRNLRICNCGTSLRMFWFAICGLLKKVCLPSSDNKKLSLIHIYLFIFCVKKL